MHSKEHSLSVHTVTRICQVSAECQAYSVMPETQQGALGSLSIHGPGCGPRAACSCSVRGRYLVCTWTIDCVYG